MSTFCSFFHVVDLQRPASGSVLSPCFHFANHILICVRRQKFLKSPSFLAVFPKAGKRTYSFLLFSQFCYFAIAILQVSCLSADDLWQ